MLKKIFGMKAKFRNKEKKNKKRSNWQPCEIVVKVSVKQIAGHFR